MFTTTTTHHRAPSTRANSLAELAEMLNARPTAYLPRCENRGMPSLLVEYVTRARSRHSAHPAARRTYCTACGETF